MRDVAASRLSGYFECRSVGQVSSVCALIFTDRDGTLQGNSWREGVYIGYGQGLSPAHWRGGHIADGFRLRPWRRAALHRAPTLAQKPRREGKSTVPDLPLESVLDFLPAICERDEDVVLVMAGKIRGFEAQEYQRQFFTQVNESSVADRIVFLRGQFPQHTFDTILSAADVVVSPDARARANQAFVFRLLRMPASFTSSTLLCFRWRCQMSS